MAFLKSVLLQALVVLPALHQAKAQLITVNCQPLSLQRSDPIVSPGITSSHVHAITGGTAFQRTMSASTAVNAKATTCDKIMDKSNYWIPQLYHQRTDGRFELVTFQGSAHYYLNRVCDYVPGRTVCDYSKFPMAPPAGLRMVAGTPTLRTYNGTDNAQRAIAHMCLQATTSKEFPSLPPEPCLRLRAEVFFPSCWDGINLDTANHKSHMAYPAIGDYNFGVCPASHPHAIFSIFYEYFFDTSVIAASEFNRLVYAMGDPTGYGLHGDFINGWTSQTALQNAFPTCVGPNGVDDPGCSLRVGGTAGRASTQVLEVPAPVEDIGLAGPLTALPGTNPVTGTPIKRKRSSSRVYPKGLFGEGEA